MPRALLLVAAFSGLLLRAQPRANLQGPSYSAASILNAASSQAGALAPNTFLSIYGLNLAYTTRGITDVDIRGNSLPTILPGTGVIVFINHVRTHIFFVSPNQINVLIPTDAFVGEGELQIVLDGASGPGIPVTIGTTAPALFESGHYAIATHADGSLITDKTPARSGEIVVLFATGLGPTIPNPVYGEIPSKAAPLRNLQQFKVTLDGVPVGAAGILYAGVSPGFAGLYQINLRLPLDVGVDPEIQVKTADAASPAGVHLRVARPGETATQPQSSFIR